MGTLMNAHIRYMNITTHVNTENGSPTGTDRASGLTLFHSWALVPPSVGIPNTPNMSELMVLLGQPSEETGPEVSLS